MVTCATSVMVPLALMFSMVIIGRVFGRPPLPPLPMKDGCFRVSPELEVFRVEGEAVILACPFFQRVLQVRNLDSPRAKYLIAKGNGTGGVADEEHVQQRDRQLWLLPAQTSDSGEYTCIYRNETYCVAGSITLQVYESASIDMENLSYPITTRVGQSVSIECPDLSCFNSIDQIEWYKDSSSTALSVDTGSSYQTERPHLMTISEVNQSHQGLYTCQLRVLINNHQYKVSRTIQLRVKDPVSQTSIPYFPMTTDPTTDSSSGQSTMDKPFIQSPKIVSPLNGTIFESTQGSGLELFCVVLTECQSAESTMVTWLVNSQLVESSYLERRALQGGRRVTTVSGGCQVEQRMVVIALSEEDTRAEFKCVTQNQGGGQEIIVLLRLEDSTFTWIVVGVVAMSCVLMVVTVFLYYLLKPKKKMDYFLARQNSFF